MVENDTGDDEREVSPLRPIKGGGVGPAWAAPALAANAEALSNPSGGEQDADGPSAPTEVEESPPQPPKPPAESSPNDDPASSGGGRRTALAVGGMALVLALAVAGIAALVLSGDDEPEKPLAESVAEISSSEETAPSSGAVSSRCESSDSADLVIGNGAGDRESGPGVILAFEHAYYEARDAKKMIALTSEDSPIRNAEALQDGIDSNPRELTHCVRISASDEGGVWDVEITQNQPDSTASEVITQRITTTKEDDKWSVKEVEAVKE